jgi:hypothetical protein
MECVFLFTLSLTWCLLLYLPLLIVTTIGNDGRLYTGLGILLYKWDYPDTSVHVSVRRWVFGNKFMFQRTRNLLSSDSSITLEPLIPPVPRQSIQSATIWVIGNDWHMRSFKHILETRTVPNEHAQPKDPVSASLKLSIATYIRGPNRFFLFATMLMVISLYSFA